MCYMDTHRIYPWADRLIELHHLLPLADPVGVSLKSTSLNDLVGLCPSCHRATHKFYSRWLTERRVLDFVDKNEAAAVYSEAKAEVVRQ